MNVKTHFKENVYFRLFLKNNVVFKFTIVTENVMHLVLPKHCLCESNFIVKFEILEIYIHSDIATSSIISYIRYLH